MRLIDADKLKDEIRKYYDMVLQQSISDGEKLAKHDMISDIMFTINEQMDVQGVCLKHE